MDDKKLLSRSEFLSIAGGMALAAFLMKFVDSKKAIAAVASAGSATSSAGYGTSAYGGKKS